MWTEIATQISKATGKNFQLQDRRSVGGGSINQAYALTDGQHTYFVKLNQADQLAMFEAEALGLQEIYQAHTIRVPQALCWGGADSSAYLVLEWLELGRSSAQAWAAMGQQLAAMHQVTSSKGFGWHQNNTIGLTPQLNPWTRDWATFFVEHRIGYQLQLAQRRGGHFPQSDRLLGTLTQLLTHQPQPSLVHGDLWSGNAAITQAGEPILLDPAVYFGDREVDLAMSELFGGFPADFYRGYNEVWPLDSGYKQRKVVYNLYHVLNHFNLFGGSYASQASRMIDQILSF